MDTQADYILSIESGLYAGVTRNLAAAHYVIGSSSPADIILMEDALSEAHAALSFARGKMQVEALASNVVVDGKALAEGAKIIVSLPCSFSLNGIQIKCSLGSGIADGDGAISAGFLKNFNLGPKQRTWVGIGALGIACLLFMGAPIIKALVGGASSSTLKQPKIATVPARIKNIAAVTPQELKDATDKLRRDMARFLAVQVTSDQNTVIVSGNISAADKPRFNAIAQKFDEDHAGRIELVNQLSSTMIKDRDLPKIEAYWAGQNPYVIVEGRRYFVGSKIEPGWIFDSIQDNLPQFERGGRKILIQNNQ